MNDQLAAAQALKFAEEFSRLFADERAARESAEHSMARLEDSYRGTVRALAAALELRDDATGRHAARVSALALRLARKVAPELAGDPTLEYGFLLHDVGKIGIPDAVLRKPAALDPDELALMRTHPELGERIVAEIPHLGDLARDVVAYHHEAWDGHGYPGGLSGEEIPLAARIFAVADAFDAMTNTRPYRAALSTEEGLQRIVDSAGTQFEPALVEAFVPLFSRLHAAARA